MLPDTPVVDQPSFLMVHSAIWWVSISCGGGIKTWGMWLLSGSVIALGAIPPAATEDRARKGEDAGIMVVSDPS